MLEHADMYKRKIIPVFFLGILASIVLSALLAASEKTKTVDATNPPNIIFIVLDDTGIDNGQILVGRWALRNARQKHPS